MRRSVRIGRKLRIFVYISRGDIYVDIKDENKKKKREEKRKEKERKERTKTLIDTVPEVMITERNLVMTGFSASEASKQQYCKTSVRSKKKTEKKEEKKEN